MKVFVVGFLFGSLLTVLSAKVLVKDESLIPIPHPDQVLNHPPPTQHHHKKRNNKDEAMDLIRRLTLQAGTPPKTKNGGSGCKYRKSTWSACDPTTKTRSRTLTLKKGDGSICEKSKTLSKQCNKGTGRKKGGNEKQDRNNNSNRNSNKSSRLKEEKKN